MEYDFSIENLEYFLLLLMRMLCFMGTAPFFNSRTTLRRIKVISAVVISFLTYETLGPQAVVYNSVLEYAAIVLKECAVGLILGLITNICVQTIYFAGHFIDMNMGFAMATLLDPTTGVNISVSGNLYYYLVMAMLLVTDMHQYLIKAIIETYQVVPIGQLTINASLYNTFVNFVGSYFIIGFRIALPVFAVILLTNTVLGILAKVAPQMNMFVIGFQLKIFAGLAVLFVTAGLLPMISNFIFEQMKKILVITVEGMR